MNYNPDLSALEALFDQVVQCIKDSGSRIEVNFSKKEPFDISSPEHLARLKDMFLKGRELKKPSLPHTYTDPAVMKIVKTWFDCKLDDADIDDIHKKAMAAENFVGGLLERYIADRLEPLGLIWLSGNIIKAVDFIYLEQDGSWKFVQVKNRYNTENSSSRSIREGTDIIRWFRLSNKDGSSNWAGFPLHAEALSEDDFAKFIDEYFKIISQYRRSLYGRHPAV